MLLGLILLNGRLLMVKCRSVLLMVMLLVMIWLSICLIVLCCWLKMYSVSGWLCVCILVSVVFRFG